MDKENQKQNEEELKSQTQEAETANADMEEAKAKVEEQEEEKRELTPEEKLTEELEKAQRAIEEQKDKYLRLSAEFDNFRRRSSQEKLDLVSVASEDTIKGLLPILDDCERAISALKDSADSAAAKEGTELIYNKLLAYLKSKGLAAIEARGLDFDTDVHEAVAQFPVQEEDKKGKVYDVVQTGYTLNGKVIRFAKVVVGI